MSIVVAPQWQACMSRRAHACRRVSRFLQALACAAALLLQGCGGAHPGMEEGSTLALPPGCDRASSTPWTQATAADDSRTVARIWHEQALESVRRDFPRPTVHARNLFHISAAMYDAWAAFDDTSQGYLHSAKHQDSAPEQARRTAMSYAAFHLQLHRTRLSFDRVQSQARLVQQMKALGLEPCHIDTAGPGPAALGNRIAAQYVAFGLSDGANEGDSSEKAYLDTTGWVSVNERLSVGQAFVPAQQPFPDKFQLLEMAQATTQNGIATSNVQSYVTPHWGRVSPFALVRTSPASPYLDTGPLPAWNSQAMQAQLLDVIHRTAWLDPDPARDVLINVSPSVMGNASVGRDDGTGHRLNPVTGKAYPQSLQVSRSLWGRVLADHWADGPDSETPPGHWNLIANELADDETFKRRFEKEDRMQWEVKTYFMLNAALHDTAIAAWEIKRLYQSARPISLIRHRAALGQNSDPALPSYHPHGLPLVPGLIELATESSLLGPHAWAGASAGQLLIRSQVTPSFGGLSMPSRLDWQPGVSWSPYQPVNFVSPAFPGLVSGHSAFSRAAAVVLSERTGSRFFPSGLRFFEVRRLRALDVRTADGQRWQEWHPEGQTGFHAATYEDAADLSGLSRRWGGIHIESDDLLGRRMGQAVGQRAARKAASLWTTVQSPSPG